MREQSGCTRRSFAADEEEGRDAKGCGGSPAGSGLQLGAERREGDGAIALDLQPLLHDAIADVAAVRHEPSDAPLAKHRVTREAVENDAADADEAEAMEQRGEIGGRRGGDHDAGDFTGVTVGPLHRDHAAKRNAEEEKRSPEETA
ncbi:MAG TPA: hypothetical protein VF765_09365 [Polyangiaceae bacterium]